MNSGKSMTWMIIKLFVNMIQASLHSKTHQFVLKLFIHQYGIIN